LTPEAKCQQLVELLSAKAKHQVVKDGAKLGEQLVKLVLEGGDDTVWKLLAEFWSEMILFVASDNLKGHKAAIARVGDHQQARRGRRCCFCYFCCWCGLMESSIITHACFNSSVFFLFWILQMVVCCVNVFLYAKCI
jgi:hypothetical protein